MPNYSIQDEIEGGVFRKGSGRGHEGARIAVSLDEIRARTDGGEDVSIPWPGVKIQRGGEGEVFVHSADRKLSIFSSDPQFLRALEGAGGNDVNDMISRLQGQRVSNRTKHVFREGRK